MARKFVSHCLALSQEIKIYKKIIDFKSVTASVTVRNTLFQCHSILSRKHYLSELEASFVAITMKIIANPWIQQT